MRRMFLFAALGAIFAARADAAEPLPAPLENRMAALSASLEEDGPGWTQYASLLHPNYARWVIGESYQQRDEFLQDLKEWWEYGMRVKSRDMEIVSADLTGNIAIVRIKISEMFVGPDDDASSFEGFVINTWVRDDGQWLLLSADIAPLPSIKD